MHPLPGARCRGFLAPGVSSAALPRRSISNRTGSGGFRQRRCTNPPHRRLSFASSCGRRAADLSFIQFLSYSYELNTRLFSRLSTCAPAAGNACGSCGSPTLWTRSKAFGPPRPHQLAAYFHGTAGVNHAGATIRAGAIIRARLGGGYWVGCCYQKQQNLYIYAFLFFHFLYDFSKSIGTTQPFNLNRKNIVGKLLTYFCFYKTTSGCHLTLPPSKVHNPIGVSLYASVCVHLLLMRAMCAILCTYRSNTRRVRSSLRKKDECRY